MGKSSVSQKRAYIWIAVSSEAQMTDDKISLEEQETVCRLWCERNAVHVMGVLKVPGLSRSESDVLDLFDEYASKGIFAYHELRKLWKSRGFDYLVVYVLNRLGRSSSLYAYAMENTVRAGGTIISVTEGIRVDESNVELMLPMGSFASTSEIKNLKLRRKMGMKSRAERGLKQSTWTPFGFVEERDALGKATRMVPDPDKRRLLDDAAALLLDGVPYLKLEKEAYEKYGHGRGGKPYPPGTLHYMFFSPTTWGNVAQGHRNSRGSHPMFYGAWAWGKGPVPPGVSFYANTVTPLFEGDLAARIQAELGRRMHAAGNSRPRSTTMFNSLLVCDVCGWYMVLNQSKHGDPSRPKYVGYRCETWRRADTRPHTPCRKQSYLSEDNAIRYVSALIENMLATRDLGDFDPRRYVATADPRPAIRADIDKVDAEMRNLAKAIRQTPSDNPAWLMLNDDLTALGNQRQRLDEALNAAEQSFTGSNIKDQYAALEEIRAMSLENFWQQPSRTINQLLHRLMGSYRLSVEDGKFIHVVAAPPSNHDRANKHRVT